MQGANDKLYWIEGLSNRHTVKCNKKKGCVKTLFTTSSRENRTETLFCWRGMML